MSPRSVSRGRWCSHVECHDGDWSSDVVNPLAQRSYIPVSAVGGANLTVDADGSAIILLRIVRVGQSECDVNGPDQTRNVWRTIWPGLCSSAVGGKREAGVCEANATVPAPGFLTESRIGRTLSPASSRRSTQAIPANLTVRRRYSTSGCFGPSLVTRSGCGCRRRSRRFCLQSTVPGGRSNTCTFERDLRFARSTHLSRATAPFLQDSRCRICFSDLGQAAAGRPRSLSVRRRM